jgi:hypothetical protein
MKQGGIMMMKKTIEDKRKNITSITIILGIMFILPFFLMNKKLCSQSLSYWAKTYGGVKDDVALSIEQTKDGSYIVIGHTQSFGSGGWDLWLLKLDINGNIQWEKSYGGPGDEVYTASIEQTKDEGYIVATMTNSFGAGDFDFWILKLDKNGNIQWQKTYGGINEDRAFMVKQTKDGGYIVIGDTRSFGIWDDLWILKLNPNGEIQWQKAYGGPYMEDGYVIQQTKDNGYIAVGATQSFEAGFWDFWVLKLDENGNIQWQKSYGGKDDDGYTYALQSTLDNGYIIGGWSRSFSNKHVGWILKIDGNGNIQWQKAYKLIGEDRIFSIKQINNNEYIVSAGYDCYYGGSNCSDFWIFKIDSNGNIKWQKSYGGIGMEIAQSLQIIDNGYIISGCTTSFGAGLWDIWILKLNIDGNVTFDLDSGAQVIDTNAMVFDTNAMVSETNAIITNTDAIVNNTNIIGINTNAIIKQQAPPKNNLSPSVPILLSPSDGVIVSPTPTFKVKSVDPMETM